MKDSPITSFQVESRALRPVAARIISYGRSAKMAQHATLYVLRVARSGREWYVARRYSEFRALYTTLQTILVRPHAHTESAPSHPNHTTGRMCPQCRELARAFTMLEFPSRFRVRSGFASSKEKIESARMQQLNAFVQILMETTQGLLAMQDDDEYDDWADETNQHDQENDQEPEDRCDALRLVREFLLVHEHLHDDKKKVSLSQPTTTSSSQSNPLPLAASAEPETPRRRPRLTSSGSFGSAATTTATMAGSTTTFRVHELDVMYRPTSPLSTWSTVGIEAVVSMAQSPQNNLLPEQELDELFLSDYASPAEDAVIHRQLNACEEDADAVARPVAVAALRRAESMRMSRRL